VCAAAAVTTSGTVSAAGASASPGLTTLFAESFAAPTTAQPSWTRPTSGAWNQACLTAGDSSTTAIPGCASPAVDSPGTGALRLTPSTYSAVGTAYYDAGLPTAHGIDVTFNTYQWALNGGHAGDGISFILAATDPTNPTAPTTVGPPGGALGYTGVSGNPGVEHGYLGFGLDTVGGFGSAPPGDPDCPASTGSGQSVAVRGPGDGASGYCVLGVQASNGALDEPYAAARPSAVPVEVALNPADTAETSRGGDLVPAHGWLVRWTSYSGTAQTMSGALPTAADLQSANVPAGWYDPATSLPYQLSFGWAGSTGAWQEVHEIDDVQATTLAGQLPVYDLRTDDDSAGTIATDGSGTLTVTPSLSADGGDETRPATVSVTTTLPAGLTPTNPSTEDYHCTTTGQVVSCTSTMTGPIPAGVDLPALVIPVNGSAAQTGLQTVTAKVSSTDGNPAVSNHQVAVKGRQAVSITSTPTGAPQPGGSYQLTGAGGDSGNPVTFSLDPATTNTACSLAGDTVTFAHAGDCVLDANQAGDDSYLAAPQTQQTVAVGRRATAVTVDPSVPTSVYGEAPTATATVTSDGPVDGTVQFTVDGTAVGAAAAPGPDGSVTSPALTAAGGSPLAAGAHQIGATFSPDDTTVYAGSTATHPLVVEKAVTTTSLAVRARSLSGTVVTPPGAGTPTGSVTFTVDGARVGSAPLVAGVATLPYTTRADRTRHVAALYGGDADHLASSVSRARRNPTISAHLTSAHPRSRYGWYRSPVTVRFTCTANDAPLTSTCPRPVTLRRNAVARTVTRTITADDGGMATVTTSGIDIDRTAPKAHLGGVTPGGYFFAAAPRGRCQGTDALAGVASCTLHHHRTGSTDTITAKVTDRAGNTRTTSVSAHVVRFFLAGAPRNRHGVYTVRRGHTYTLLAQTAARPRYVDAALYPRRPHGEDNRLHRIGHHRWAVGVTFQPGMRSGTRWNIGVRTGRTVHVLTVYVRR
jgi:hypothetical protein